MSGTTAIPCLFAGEARRREGGAGMPSNIYETV